ncbi:unnamed protein product [Pipistrellus nathusii]|uniref:Uncharacterized protein n=1 Tax=Pipistrellus nathusii TaxID=59473 RepID=A0ABN9Z6M9_PIPNA
MNPTNVTMTANEPKCSDFLPGLPTRPSPGKGRRGEHVPHISCQALNYSLARSNLFYVLTLFCSLAQTSLNDCGKRFFRLEWSRSYTLSSEPGSSLSGTSSRGRDFTASLCLSQALPRIGKEVIITKQRELVPPAYKVSVLF